MMMKQQRKGKENESLGRAVYERRREKVNKFSDFTFVFQAQANESMKGKAEEMGNIMAF